MAPRLLRVLLVLVVSIAVGASAKAASCELALDQWIDRPRHGEADGSSAAALLAAATRLAEPALPAVERWSAEGERGEVAEPAIRFLADRGLLPADWNPTEALAEGVVAVLDRLLESFGGRQIDVSSTPRESILDLRDVIDAALADVRVRVRPAAVLVWNDDRELAMRALIWNWSSYPRLVLFPPGLGESSVVTRAEAITSMENCVREIDHWFSVDEATARQLLAKELTTRVVVVGTEPDQPDLTPWWVPVGEELDVLAYEHPVVSDLDAFSVVFTGEPLPFTAWLRLLPHVRTNASPFDLRRYLQTPPSVGDR